MALLGFAAAARAADDTGRVSFDAIASMMLQPLEACFSNLGSAPIMADLTGPTNGEYPRTETATGIYLFD
ncbi:MAG: hypothetical protein Q8S00_26545 [Deltaproteobacteria bacterium]|nr:hypothetical protein [Deltaproteobacteria bacterium]